MTDSRLEPWSGFGHFNTRSRRVYKRAIQYAIGHGFYNHWSQIPASSLALLVDAYLTQAKADPGCKEIKQKRHVARLYMADCGLIGEKQVPVGLLDKNGIDVDIKRLARPLEFPSLTARP